MILECNKCYETLVNFNCDKFISCNLISRLTSHNSQKTLKGKDGNDVSGDRRLTTVRQNSRTLRFSFLFFKSCLHNVERFCFMTHIPWSP